MEQRQQSQRQAIRVFGDGSGGGGGGSRIATEIALPSRTLKGASASHGESALMPVLGRQQEKTIRSQLRRSLSLAPDNRPVSGWRCSEEQKHLLNACANGMGNAPHSRPLNGREEHLTYVCRLWQHTRLAIKKANVPCTHFTICFSLSGHSVIDMHVVNILSSGRRTRQ